MLSSASLKYALTFLLLLLATAAISEFFVPGGIIILLFGYPLFVWRVLGISGGAAVGFGLAGGANLACWIIVLADGKSGTAPPLYESWVTVVLRYAAHGLIIGAQTFGVCLLALARRQRRLFYLSAVSGASLGDLIALRHL